MSARVLILSAFLLLPLHGQQGPREFEVISVKPNPAGPKGGASRIFDGKPVPRAKGNTLIEPRTTLQWLVMEAYGLNDYEIVGLPDWAAPRMGGTYFEVEAIAPGTETATTADIQQMLQSLLATRFALKTHRESKQLPVYALVIGKNGSKLQPLTDDEKPSMGRSTPEEQPFVDGSFAAMFTLMSRYADRPIVDETGLHGNYRSANLDYDQFLADRRSDPQGAWTSFADEVKNKWGLEVKPRVDTVNVLVIDHAELPSAND
jgi:uncharacterized protein (TIGR03435 family)